MIVLLVLAAMSYQDARYRGIVWWLFPLLFIMLSILSARDIGMYSTVCNFALNGLFIVVQVLFLAFYFSIRRKKITNIFNGYLGLGDFLLLVSLAVYFPVLSFVGFYVLSLLAVICITLIVTLILKIRIKKIPLAGYQAALFFVLVLVELSSETIRFSRDLSFFTFF